MLPKPVQHFEMLPVVVCPPSDFYGISQNFNEISEKSGKNGENSSKFYEIMHQSCNMSWGVELITGGSENTNHAWKIVWRVTDP